MKENSSLRQTKQEPGKTNRNPFAVSKAQKVLNDAERNMAPDEFKRFSDDFRREAAAVRKRQMIILAIAALVMTAAVLLVLKRLFT